LACASASAIMSSSTTKDDGEARARFASYRAMAPDRSGVVSAPSPESIRDFLRCETAWPPGCYAILRASILFDAPSSRWGIVIKHPDGRVELVPDQA
jgi:hypothetical protein